MWSIRKWRDERAKKLADEKEQEHIDTANSMFQIEEHDNKVWLTLNGTRVCPVSMFNEKDPVLVLGIIRNLYLIEKGVCRKLYVEGVNAQ
jgi:hypothetical protein